MSLRDSVAIGFVVSLLGAIAYSLAALIGAHIVAIVTGLAALPLIFRRNYARPHHR